MWQRATTKETELAAAIEKAKEMLYDRQALKRQNLPVVTRKFRVIANLAMQRMDDEIANGHGTNTDMLTSIELE